MKSNGAITFFLWVVIGGVGLIFIGNRMINNGEVKPLSEYLKEQSFFAKTIPIKTPIGTIDAEIASDETSRSRGLSGRDILGQGQGMLFVFSELKVPSFWMKDMKFPLDIVWINEHKVVSDISYNVLPSSYPKYYSPKSAVMYALEINSGSADKFGIEVGTQLYFDTQ